MHPRPEGRVLPCVARPPCGDPAPAGHALDGASPASIGSYTSLVCLSAHELRAKPCWRCHLGLAFSAMRETDVRPLTLPVAPRSNPVTRALSRSQDRFHHPLVKEDDFPDPKRLPSTGCSLVLPLSRPDWFGGNPPPVSRFSHRRSGFRRSFASPTLSRGRARPIIVVRRLFVPGREGPRAACRLLQSIRSASTTADHRNPA